MATITKGTYQFKQILSPTAGLGTLVISGSISKIPVLYNGSPTFLMINALNLISTEYILGAGQLVNENGDYIISPLGINWSRTDGWYFTVDGVTIPYNFGGIFEVKQDCNVTDAQYQWFINNTIPYTLEIGSAPSVTPTAYIYYNNRAIAQLSKGTHLSVTLPCANKVMKGDIFINIE